MESPHNLNNFCAHLADLLGWSECSGPISSFNRPLGELTALQEFRMQIAFQELTGTRLPDSVELQHMSISDLHYYHLKLIQNRNEDLRR